MTHWVLLRGLTREARHWGELPVRMAAGLQNGADTAAHRVTLLDLPGNGAFHNLASPSRVVDMVAFARSQLQSVGMPPPYALLAMSLGGMVATDWAQRFPAEVSQLVLVNTSMRPFSGLTERLRPARWAGLVTLALRWGDASHAQAHIHGITCHRQNTRDADLLAWEAICRDAPVRGANALRQLLAAARFAAAPTAPNCPVLLLSSAQDRLVNPVCSQQLATAWQQPHCVHPWAGHDLPHDDPAWVCQAVLGGLARA